MTMWIRHTGITHLCVHQVKACSKIDMKFVQFIITGSLIGMLSSVNCVIIGHFSIDGKLKSNHFNSQQPIPNIFQVEENTSANPPSDLFRILVEKFSFNGQTILDCLTEGKIMIIIL